MRRGPTGAPRPSIPSPVRALLAALACVVILGAVLLTASSSSAHAAQTSQPWSMIVSLDMTIPTGTRNCTGFMIGPHTVGTAGHCLYDTASGGWPTSVRVTPGVNGLDAPFASVFATGYTTTELWAKNKDYRYDFGVVQLGTDQLGQATGWFDISALSDQELLASTFTTAGYRADAPYQTMWALTPPQPIAAVDQSLMYYRWNVTHGQSGSPVFLSAGDRYTVAGLVNACRGNPCDETSVDFGVRVTVPIADFFRAQVAERLQPSTPAPPTVFTTSSGKHVTLSIQGQNNAAAVLQRSTDSIRWETLLSGTTDATGRTTFDVAATVTAFYRGVILGSGPTNPVRGAVEALASPAAPGQGIFAAAPAYSTSGLANAVFLRGSIAELEAALIASGASGAWAQTPSGAWALYIVGGGGVVNGAFASAFPTGFSGPTALTLVRK